MTAATLRSFTCKDLGQMAKQEGVVGWHSMRKEELIKALVLAARRKARAGENGVSTAARTSRARRGRGSQAASSRKFARSQTNQEVPDEPADSETVVGQRKRHIERASR